MNGQVKQHTEIGTFRVVSLEGTYYAVPKSWGSVNPRDLKQRSAGSVLSKPSLSELVNAITQGHAPLISIVMPTRGRPAMLRQALDSIRDTAHDPNAIEIVLVVDSDDSTMADFSYKGLPLQRIVVAPGMTMGGLNNAGADAALGQYLFALNDDIVARTPGWDTKVLEALRSFPDGIVLVNVNDLVFRDSLCIFPLLTRTYYELSGGICHPDYIRYRNDDHIHNVFNLLALLGQRRIVYMPEVIFEHLNKTFDSSGNEIYVPEEMTHKKDTEVFDKALDERKALALRLMEHIDAFSRQNLSRVRSALLEPVTDSVAIRDPAYSRHSQAAEPPNSQNSRVTIGIVSADIDSPHARYCIEKVKAHTRNYDLVLLDNNRGPNFNHSREMNRLIAGANTEYLVLMDDDVFVEPGWLDGLLSAVKPTVGIVTPGHKNARGEFTYGGIVMQPDGTGHHSHIFSRKGRPERVQTICSAVFLIDLSKCGHLRVDERYSKYFLDIDYGLQVWEAGYEVVCNTATVVTHVGGATFMQAGPDGMYERQRRRFAEKWIDTGRFKRLEETVWQSVPEIKELLDVRGKLEQWVSSAAFEPNGEKARGALQQISQRLSDYPALLFYAASTATRADAIRQRRTEFDGEWDVAVFEGLAKALVAAANAKHGPGAPWYPPLSRGLYLGYRTKRLLRPILRLPAVHRWWDRSSRVKQLYRDEMANGGTKLSFLIRLSKVIVRKFFARFHRRLALQHKAGTPP